MDVFDGKCSKAYVWTKQKSVELMDLRQKYSKPGDVLSDELVGTLSTFKAFLFLDKHGPFVK